MSDVQPGLEGVVAFETEIAEPDKEGGALRYRGVDIEDLVGQVPFGNVWGLLVDGAFEPGLPPAEPFPIPVHSGDVRVDVQSALAMLAPVLGLPAAARHRRRAGPRRPRPGLRHGAVVRRAVGARPRAADGAADARSTRRATIVERFMIRWRGRARPRARPGGRRLLHLGRRARHERLDVHRAGRRLHRRRRGRRAVGAPSARCPARCTAARRPGCWRMIDEVERTGDAEG